MNIKIVQGVLSVISHKKLAKKRQNIAWDGVSAALQVLGRANRNPTDMDTLASLRRRYEHFYAPQIIYGECDRARYELPFAQYSIS